MGMDSGKASRMQRLHQQRADPADEGAEVRMDDPRSLSGLEKTRALATGNRPQPRWNSAWVVEKQRPQAFRKQLLNGRILWSILNHGIGCLAVFYNT